ncbi:unnamed protein product, partial [Amoebophrya sp. A25]|eukprot:GSA25T00012756001.1
MVGGLEGKRKENEDEETSQQIIGVSAKRSSKKRNTKQQVSTTSEKVDIDISSTSPSDVLIYPTSLFVNDASVEAVLASPKLLSSNEKRYWDNHFEIRNAPELARLLTLLPREEETRNLAAATTDTQQGTSQRQEYRAYLTPRYFRGGVAWQFNLESRIPEDAFDFAALTLPYYYPELVAEFDQACGGGDRAREVATDCSGSMKLLQELGLVDLSKAVHDNWPRAHVDVDGALRYMLSLRDRV